MPCPPLTPLPVRTRTCQYSSAHHTVLFVIPTLCSSVTMCKHIQIDVNKHLFLLEHAFVQSSGGSGGGGGGGGFWSNGWMPAIGMLTDRLVSSLHVCFFQTENIFNLSCLYSLKKKLKLLRLPVESSANLNSGRC